MQNKGSKGTVTNLNQTAVIIIEYLMRELYIQGLFVFILPKVSHTRMDLLVKMGAVHP